MTPETLLSRSIEARRKHLERVAKRQGRADRARRRREFRRVEKDLVRGLPTSTTNEEVAGLFKSWGFRVTFVHLNHGNSFWEIEVPGQA